MQRRYHSNCNHFSLVTVSNSPMWQVSNRKGVGLKMAQILINGQHMIIFNYYQYGVFVTPWTNERKMQMFQLLSVPVGLSKTKYSIEITTNSFWHSSIVAVLRFINCHVDDCHALQWRAKVIKYKNIKMCYFHCKNSFGSEYSPQKCIIII